MKTGVWLLNIYIYIYIYNISLSIIRHTNEKHKHTSSLFSPSISNTNTLALLSPSLTPLLCIFFFFGWKSQLLISLTTSRSEQISSTFREKRERKAEAVKEKVPVSKARERKAEREWKRERKVEEVVVFLFYSLARKKALQGLARLPSNVKIIVQNIETDAWVFSYI